MTAGQHRALRAGIVGGGEGAFIGAVHRIAAELDSEARVVSGAMSSRPDVAARSAAAWGLDRSFENFEAMAAAESGREDGIDFVIVATPNHLHLPVAQAFLEAGIHVICDKPLAASLAEAEAIHEKAKALKESRILVEYVRAQQWNGQLPRTMMGDGQNILWSMPTEKP